MILRLANQLPLGFIGSAAQILTSKPSGTFVAAAAASVVNPACGYSPVDNGTAGGTIAGFVSWPVTMDRSTRKVLSPQEQIRMVSPSFSAFCYSCFREADLLGQVGCCYTVG